MFNLAAQKNRQLPFTGIFCIACHGKKYYPMATAIHYPEYLVFVHRIFTAKYYDSNA
jgi:hypothetical protein